MRWLQFYLRGSPLNFEKPLTQIGSRPDKEYFLAASAKNQFVLCVVSPAEAPFPFSAGSCSPTFILARFIGSLDGN